MKQSLGVFEHAGQTKGTDYANAMSFVASLYGESGNAREAFAWNVRTEQAVIALGRSGTLTRIIILQNRAMELLRAGQARQAEEVQEDVLRRLTSDGADPDVPPPHWIDQGRILTRLGRSNEAVKVLQSGVDGSRLRHLDSWEATGNFTLGLAQLDLGHLEEAGRQFDAAESYWRVKEPHNQRWLSPLRQGRAKLAAARGQMDEARAQVRELLQDLGYPASDRSLFLGPAMLTAAALELRAGASEQAEAFAVEAVRLAERAAIDKERSADLGEALLVLARVHMERHDAQSPRELLERAIRCLANGVGPDHPSTRMATSLLQTY
jgi:tetratricopeptide (TPR) repeat protein